VVLLAQYSARAPAMAGHIFFCHRADEDGPYVARLRAELVPQLGQRMSTQDVHAVEAVVAGVSRCPQAVVLIGPSWLEVRTPGGLRLLDRPDDEVRVSLVASLALGRPLTALLLGEARLPTREELPEPLAALADLDPVRLATPDGDLTPLLARLRPPGA
jgi:hypothetical protein